MTDTIALPVIATERLLLRALDTNDADDLRRLTDDPLILGAVNFLPNPFAKNDAEALIARNAGGQDCFLGGRVAGGELATVCGAHLRGDDEVEIGYWVGSAFAGRGLAAEATQALLATLRAHFPHRRIFAECRPENQRSRRLLRKLGFVTTGEQGHRPGRERYMWFSASHREARSRGGDRGGNMLA